MSRSAVTDHRAVCGQGGQDPPGRRAVQPAGVPQGERGSASRRQLFKFSGLAVAAVGGGWLLEGCGSDADESAAKKSGGILIHGARGSSSKDTLDAHAPVTNPDIARVSNLLEPLLFWDADYQLASALAEQAEPSADALTWTVTLRDRATFHNGKPVTAEDVLFSIRRVADPKAPTSAGVALAPIIDLNGTKKADDKTVTIKLKTPYAVLDMLLAEYTFGIVPADYDPKTPIGTGPFQYKSFTPGKDSVFTRYADYWGDKALIVEELHIQDLADPNAQVNALQAGQIQTIDNLPYNLIDTMKG